jgi:hypothetical protein
MVRAFEAILGHGWCSNNGIQLHERAFPLLLVLIQVIELGVPVRVLLILESEVVHGVVLVKPAAFDAFQYLLRVNVVLLVQDVDDCVLDYDVLVLEVDEMSFCWLVGKAKFTCSQLPEPNPMFGIHEDGCE